MKVVENDIVKYWIEDGILYSEFPKEARLTLENVKVAIALRHKISNNENQYWCLSFDGLKSYPKDAMKYAELHGQDNLHAAAVIVKSHVAMFMYNSFALFRKVRIPVRSFTNKDKAVEWLKEMKNKN